MRSFLREIIELIPIGLVVGVVCALFIGVPLAFIYGLLWVFSCFETPGPKAPTTWQDVAFWLVIALMLGGVKINLGRKTK